MAQIWSILEKVLRVFEKNMDSAIIGSFLLALLCHSCGGKIAVMFEDTQAALRTGPYGEKLSPPAHSHLSE